ncbi:asparagine synthase (glutamine-hydrolyzing) [Acidithiobacillus sp.]|uniref:asparagine synthase (glutamine-hydrolyzing) n=1 Tax=Acidithiobacillus sp. TaxID=1872118 RepID=UPI0025B7F03E|nr:asparagine synthase (glutamine-hydrolyzing) [Acidithiobacillus sp.]MCK9187959.1 asparagine synthase (glutamine-hydrolyzing) [Acidithiobacillus sp.]MCK9359918.1 asparagine synthase (glutamine-hydrolyzing) [Acidithiobacillus sp.]
MLLRIREAMRVRGPDDAGLWVDDAAGVGLAHRRLSIVDLSERGAQPMASPDQRLHVVFNGEIYNHKELRAWCEARGARYVSDSDTETLLHLYDLLGADFVNRLRGMFAFALWDGKTQQLLLARDPFGIKPLYYVDDGQQLLFASQVKALMAGGVTNILSSAGLVSFCLWGYVTDPHTIYRDIHALPAGHQMFWRRGQAAIIRSYCDPLEVLRTGARQDLQVADLHAALADSMRHHLIADVPVGLFLSGGIDSSALLSLATECADPASLQTVTLGFQEYTGQEQDEVPQARATAQRVGVNHRVVQYGRQDFIEERTRLFAAMDQPTIDGVNTYFVSKATVAGGLKVALSGVGGDEVFGGYPSFRDVPRLVHRLHGFPSGWGKWVRHVLSPTLSRRTSPKYAGVLEYGGTISGAYLLRRALFMPWEIPALLGDEIASEGLGSLDVMGNLNRVIHGIASPHDQVMALELAVYLKNCLLRDADWAGMAHSLEIRTPLVDAQLFKQLIVLRSAHEGKPWTKKDFGQAPRRPLPNDLLIRPKTGFAVPVRDWLCNDVQGRHGHAPMLRGHRAWAVNILDSFGGTCPNWKIEGKTT